jgi:uncharacterized OB-fold protein
VNTQIIKHEIQLEPLATRIALHPFLAGMNHTQLALLTDCAVSRHFKTNQIILRQGEFANGFYLVETGKVALESLVGFNQSIPLQIVGAGDLLGWSWMFPPYVWQFTARAIEPTTTLFFYAAILREYCEKDLTKIDEEWVVLANEGVVANFTIVRYHDRHLPRRAPYILALIQVDGADTPFAHIVECGLDEIRLGMRVKAVYAETEASTLMNIDHFEPI